MHDKAVLVRVYPWVRVG